MAIEEAQLISETAHGSRPAADRPAAHRRPAARAEASADGRARTPEEIRRSIEANRAELGMAVEKLRGEVAEVTDWREQLRRAPASRC